MTELVLVYPPVSINGRYGKVATGHEVPPQPLIFLGAYLRAHNEDCRLIDANALSLNIEETVNQILSHAPKYVGFTSPTMLISTVGKIAEKIKGLRPDIVTIAGGPHISAMPYETMKLYRHIDIGVIGEGELTLIQLLNALRNTLPLGGINGIIYRDNVSLKITAARMYIEDIDTLPFPAWDMLPEITKYYQQSAARIDRLPNISLVSSRGCPFQCIFCARNVFGNVTRTHSAEYILKMIQYLKTRYKIKSISFEDENFVIYRKRLIEFCNRIIDEKINITWDCASNVNAVTPEILSLMKKAGCWQINYGIESGSQRILDFIKKNVKLGDITRTLQMTKDAGIQTKGYFIIGHPTETLESIQETITFIKAIPLDVFQMSFMIPLPGTELYSIAHHYGAFENDWENMNIWTPLFIPSGLTREILEKESKRAYREFYLRWRPIATYAKRILKSSSSLKFIKDGFKIFKFILEGD